jgi:hypothetical protein
MAGRGYRTISVEVRGDDVSVYTSARVADALKEITQDKDLYHGVRLMQVMEAVYLQGKKDGARQAFEQIDSGVTAAVTAAKKAIPHGKPGRPRVRRRAP